jgi:hypothetical protein
MAGIEGARWRASGGVTVISWSFGSGAFAELLQAFSGYRSFDSAVLAANQATVQAAFDAWEKVANVDFVRTPDAAGVNIRIGNAFIDGRTNPSGQGSTLATTGYWFYGDYFVSQQIVLDIDAYDDGHLYAVMVHEIGHALGLGHTDQPESIMYPRITTQNASGAITGDALQAVTLVYGVAGAPYVDDYLDTPASTGVLPAGGTATGVVELDGDVDTFKLQLTEGRVYRLDMEGLSTNRGTLFDPAIQLRSGGGVLLAADDDSGEGHNAEILFVARETGTHYVRAASYPNLEVGIGSYTLALADLTATAPGQAKAVAASQNILRSTYPMLSQNLLPKMADGTLTPDGALAEVVRLAGATTSVATLSYQFFTGRIPSAQGMDFLVAPGGGNANHLNSAYYQAFNLENRYINFAVNLGKLGEGAAAFKAGYDSLSLLDATAKAYTVIFGTAPTDAKVHALVDPRADYFAFYGRDGASGIGTKAAMVGWLLAEAVKADTGMYAKANDAFLLDLADGASFSVDLIGTYGKPEFALS